MNDVEEPGRLDPHQGVPSAFSVKTLLSLTIPVITLDGGSIGTPVFLCSGRAIHRQSKRLDPDQGQDPGGSVIFILSLTLPVIISAGEPNRALRHFFASPRKRSSARLTWIKGVGSPPPYKGIVSNPPYKHSLPEVPPGTSVFLCGPEPSSPTGGNGGRLSHLST